MAYKTINEYYTQQGKSLPTWNSAERLSLAAQAGISSGYEGTTTQNQQIVDYLNKQNVSTPVASTITPTTTSIVNPATGKTNEQVLAESTAAALKAQQVAGLPASAYTPPANYVAPTTGSFSTRSDGATVFNAASGFNLTLFPQSYTAAGNSLPDFVSQGKLTSAEAQTIASRIGVSYTPPTVPTVAPIVSPIPAPKNNVADTTPTFPTPTAPVANDVYYNSLNQQLADSQAALKAAQDKQLADTQTQKAETQKQLDEIRTLQENGVLAQGSVAEQERQAKLDQLSTEQTRFDTNYNIVQGLAGQLQNLLTTGNELIAQQKAQTGLSSIMTPRINQTISDVTAQAGVIQASISAYNGQMNQAQSQLTNAVNVITSAYNDEMDYYKTLNDFYESKSADTNQKLITLTTSEKSYIDNRITELENQKKTIEDNKQKLQDIFLDPDKALKFARAGITITTPQSEWGKKLADQSYAEEIQKTSQDMANSGYSFLLEGQTAPVGTTTQTITDSKGNQKTWYKKETTPDSLKLTETEKKQNMLSQASQAFESVKGNDGYINPTDWVKLRNAWIAQGGLLKDFTDNFSIYQNPNDVYN